MTEEKDWTGSERRQWPRVPLDDEVEFSVPAGRPEQPLKSKSKVDNISVGGLLFETDEDVPVGTVLRLEIHVPDCHNPRRSKAVLGPIKTLGTVVRTEETEDGGHRIGVCFMNLSDRDRDGVDEFVRQGLGE